MWCTVYSDSFLLDFSSFRKSSWSVGWDPTAQPSIPTSINEPVAGSALFLPWTTFDKSCRFSDALTQSFQSNWIKSLPCPFFLLLAYQLWGQHVHLQPNISHPGTGSTMTCYSMVRMLGLIGVSQPVKEVPWNFVKDESYWFWRKMNHNEFSS